MVDALPLHRLCYMLLALAVSLGAGFSLLSLGYPDGFLLWMLVNSVLVIGEWVIE